MLAGYDVEAQTATLQVKVNPLVNWIWMGVGIMVVGTFIALLPERAFAFAVRSVPEGAATTSLILLLLVGYGATELRAQHVEEPQAVVVAPRTPVEKTCRPTSSACAGPAGASASASAPAA